MPINKIRQCRIPLTFWLMMSLGLLLAGSRALANDIIYPVPAAKNMSTLGNVNLGEVSNVFQSRNGYLWFSSNQGLIRYDGYTAKVYDHDPNNPHSIAHNRLFDVVEDKRGILWISSFGAGLLRFDPKTERFSRIDLKAQLNNPNVPENLYWLTLDENEQLWIASTRNIWLFDTIEQKAKPVPEPLRALPNDIIGQVLIDHKKRLWISSNFQGVYMFDGQTLHQFSDDSGPEPRLGDKTVRIIYQDHKKRIWLGIRDGLYLFNEQTFGWTLYQPTKQPELKDFVNDIFAIHDPVFGNEMWIGTSRNGAMKFNPDTGQFKALNGEHDLNKVFKPTRINKIFKDNAGSLWFATLEGLVYLANNAQKFSYISAPSGTLRTTYLQPSAPQKAHVATEFSLYELDLKSFTLSPVLVDNHLIIRFVEDEQNTWWAATLRNGLMRFTDGLGKLVKDPQQTPSDSHPADAIADILVDSQSRMWLAPYPNTPVTFGGVMHYDRKQRLQTWHHTDPTVDVMMELSKDHILLGTVPVGAISFKPSDNSRIIWSEQITGAPTRVSDLYRDSSGRIWLGSESTGLTLFDIANKKMTHYKQNDGLISNSVLSIVEDDQQNLWLATPVGLSRFNPQTLEFLNLEKQDGLQYSNFYKRSVMRADNGELLFGARSGIVKIDPQRFIEPQPVPKVMINEFRLFNNPVAMSSKDNPTVLKQSIEFTDAIELSADDYVFSFGFSATEFQRPDKIRYAYRMRGLDDKWIQTDASNRIASYTTLSDGDYIFEVKASNAQGFWSDDIAQVKVTVLPPWYLSWQAYVTYILVTLLSLYLYIRRHTLKLKKQAQVLEVKVAERTAQLQQSTDELAKQSQTVSQLLAQKQRLFASVSHEFRTPLTLILSPVEQMLRRYEDPQLGQELGLIKRNGRRLLRMVDQLLEFAKLEQQQDIQPQPIALQPTLAVITTSFNSLVESKQISLTVGPCPQATLMMLPDSLNKILINLLSNAFKYTPSGGAIEVTSVLNGDSVTIAVKDNGIGIAEQDQRAVFERFNRAIHDHGETIIGAGIGLSLVKELIEANGGEITLVSQLNKGSTFTVTLPLADPSVQLDSALLEQGPVPELLQLELDNVNAQHTAYQMQNPESNDDSKRTLLIIDDNADLRHLLSSQLSDLYHCIEASNGKVGLATAKEQIPDMILSDVMMPIMDGYELAEALKADMMTCHIPIIMLTAKGSVESRIKGLKLLIDDYQPKPFDIQELQLRIHNILTIREIVAKRSLQALEQGNNHSPNSEGPNLDLNPLEQEFVDLLYAQLDDQYGELEFGAKRLSEKLLLSERQLHRKVKALFNSSIPEFIRNYRLNKAVELLQQGHKASQVYFNVGFASHSYFSSCFKAKYGQTPSDYLKQSKPINQAH